ncbi:MAG: RecX family transcriptional regulator [Spirochaetales bacterium]|nr:RecX family transcriptional regulator [Spirochaetales bacterium]
MADTSGFILVEKIERKPKGFAICFCSNHEKLIFSEEKLLEFALYEGREIDDSQWNILYKASQFELVYQKAVSLLSLSAQSVHMLKQKLLKKGFLPSVIDEVCQKCSELGYLDDENFARLWVADRIQFKQEGRSPMVSALIQKGINPGLAKMVVDEEFSLEKEEQAAAILFERLLGHYNDPAVLLKKMVNRGFSYYLAKKRVDSYFRDREFFPED